MSAQSILGLVVGIGVLLYLVYTLLRPESF